MGTAFAGNNLQGAYDLTPGLINLSAGVGPIILRDNVVPIGDLFEIDDSANTETYFRVSPTAQDLGASDNTAAPGPVQVRVSSGSNTIQFWPSDRTFTSSPGALMRATNTYIHDYASVSFAALNLQATMQHNQAGFIFNHGLIFNHGITYRNLLNTAVNYGPIQGFIDQPTIQVNATVATAITMGLFRSFLSQPSFGRTSTAGTLTVTSAANFQGFGNVSVGATVTTWTRVQLGPFIAPTTGTIVNYRAIDIANETQPTTVITAIRSAIAAAGGGTRRNFEVTGTAISTFAGDVHVNNAIAFVLGTPAGSNIRILRSAAGIMRRIGVGGANNEGVDLDLQGTANVAEWSSSTGAGFKWSPTGAADAAASLVMGDGLSPDGTSNWWLGWSPGTRTVNLAGDWFDVLFSPGANVDLSGNAMGTVASMSLIEPGITLNGGTVTNAATLVIQNAPTEGGTLNAALWVRAGLSRFDGRVDINNGIALGGGAPATLGTIGGAGPTAAAQAQWCEIDIGGVAHWIAVWT